MQVPPPARVRNCPPFFGTSAALGLTAAQSEVAVMLAQGRTPKEIAVAAERRENTGYRLLKQIYGKVGVSRQADLVRLVLSLAGLSRTLLLRDLRFPSCSFPSLSWPVLVTRRPAAIM